jgi:hypothetical protein
METRVTMCSSAIYELQVRGELDECWLGLMEIATIETVDSQAQGIVTLMTGSFQDQAALRGLLDRLYRLNLPLISVRHISEDSRHSNID